MGCSPAFLLLLGMTTSSLAFSSSFAKLSIHTPRGVASSLAIRKLNQPRLQQQADQEVLVHRGTLAGAHVHVAKILISAVLSVWSKLTGATTPRTPITPQPKRSHEPVFLNGALCELVIDDETGHQFWVCMSNASDGCYRCQKMAKGGSWIYFCVK